jgi:hypothetical protein
VLCGQHEDAARFDGGFEANKTELLFRYFRERYVRLKGGRKPS